MRILAVCTSNRVFGAETIMLSLLAGLQERAHALQAVTSIWTDGKFQRRLLEHGVPFTRLPLGFLSKKLNIQPMIWTANSILRIPEAWSKYQALISAFSPDVVLLSSPMQGWSLYPFLRKVPSFMHVQYGTANTEWSRKTWGLLDRKLAGWVACSEYIKRHMLEFGMTDPKVTVIRSGILHRGTYPNYKVDQRTEKVVIGIAGQIGEWKGHGDLMQACGILKAQRHQFRLRIFGSGDEAYVGKLKAMAIDLGIADRVEWMGYSDSKLEIFGGMHICVVPSRFQDPYPTVAMEAAGFGIPVVGTAVGGLPEIIQNGQTGLLVAAANPEELAVRLIPLVQSALLRANLGSQAQEFAWRNFTRESMTEGFDALFSSKGKHHLGMR